MILIIAYGNDLREDDGAGLILASHLQEAWRARSVIARQVAVRQLVPELAADIVTDGVSAVVFVDTRVARSPTDWDVTVTPVAAPGMGTAALGHYFDPGLLLAYASALADARVPPAWLVTTPGTQFGHGQELSAQATTAMARALQDQDGALQWLLRRYDDTTDPGSAPDRLGP
jgi:hydrogenase maturation protease